MLLHNIQLQNLIWLQGARVRVQCGDSDMRLVRIDVQLVSRDGDGDGDGVNKVPQSNCH